MRNPHGTARRLSLPLALLLLLSGRAEAAVQFYVNDEAGWTAAWVAEVGTSFPWPISSFETGYSEIQLSNEAGYPVANQNLGPVLTFEAASTGLCRSFGIRTFGGVGMVWSDVEGTTPPNFDGALSIGDIDNDENDDFEILISSGPPLFAMAFTLADSDGPDASESLTVHGHDGAVLGTLPGLSIPAGNVTLGMISDEPIRRVVFDEDAGGDDIAVKALRFDDPRVRDGDGDGLSDCDEAQLFLGDPAAFTAAWESQEEDVPPVESFPTSAAHVGLADERPGPPGPNTNVGNTLTFDRANTGLCHGFTVRTAQGQNMTFDDDEGAGNLPNFDAALSIGDIDNEENDDFEVLLSSGNPTYAFGMQLTDNGVETYESLTVFDPQGRLIVSLSDNQLPQAAVAFVGVHSDNPIGRVRFDEGTGGDDLAVRDFWFGGRTDLDQDTTPNCADADVDGDGIPNDAEEAAGLDASDRHDAAGDLDQDAWSNLDEHLFGTDLLDAADNPAPLLRPFQKVVPSDGGAFGHFARSVAIDGALAALAASGSADPLPEAVYVFERSGGVWSEGDKLLSPSGPDNQFARSVAVSGETILVGGSNAAWAFTRSAGVWSAVPLAVGEATSDLGSAVAIEGDRAVVGSAGDGAAFVFSRSAGVWSEDQKLTGAGGSFGASVSVSGDSIAVGAVFEANDGAAYVFVFGGSSFAQEQRLAPGAGGALSGFGSDVALEGDTLVVGARSHDHGSLSEGEAYVFDRSGGVWTETAVLPRSDGETSTLFFGQNVALAGDRALVGLAFHYARSTAYLYDRSSGSWLETRKLFSQALNDTFGWDVALGAETALVSAWQDDELAESSGAAHFFPLADSDGDGLLDAAEAAWGSDPGLVDSDGDGLLDGYEAEHALDPVLGGQGGQDPDGDGLDNATEQSLGTHPRLADSDGDLLRDAFEVAAGFDPLQPGESGQDPDGDGLDNLGEQAAGTPPLVADVDADGAGDATELANGTDPYVADSDGDSLLDGFEIAHGLDPLTSSGEAGLDPDGDGLDNLGEQTAGTQPFEPDTDLDGVNDGDEVAGGADPLAYSRDADGDGIPNEVEAAAGLLPADLVDGPLDLDADGWSNADEYRFGTGLGDDVDTPAGLLHPHQKVFGSPERPNGWFGHGVAIDGDTAVIGMPYYGPLYPGAALVFERVGGRWVEQALLEPPDPTMEDLIGRMGWSAAIDGDTVALGALVDGGGRGKVHVFTRDGGGWSVEASLAASVGSDWLGASVAVDGDTLVAGVPDGDVAYVFARVAGVWTEQARLTASDGAPGHDFGASVAVDGDTVVIGAPEAGAGGAYVFTRSAGVWTELARLDASDAAASDRFGAALDLEDGTLVVGAPGDDDLGPGSGSAYVFTESAGVWSERTKLLAGDGAAAHQLGGALSLSGDAVLVGAPGQAPGAAYRFEGSGSAWLETARVAAADAVQSAFARDVALSGADALVGAHLGASSFGSAYYFRFGDADGDGLSDAQEAVWGTLPDVADTDADGADDFAEVGVGTDPTAFDTDGDGFGDGAELAAGSDPLDPDSTPPAAVPVPVGPWTPVLLALALAGAGWRRLSPGR